MYRFLRRMRRQIVSWTVPIVLAWSSAASANLCPGDPVDDVHEAEAQELERQAYSSGSNCAAGGVSCFVGVRDYNARVIACNRKRDVKPFKLGPIDDLPLVHKAAGRLLDDRNASERQFASNLDPRMVSGQIQYFGKFPKWYGYVLERDQGNWIVTTIIDFKWPNAESKVIHLPIYLTTRLSTQAGGAPLTSSICSAESSGKSDEGMIVLEDSNGTRYDRACRVDRHRQLFAIDDGVSGNVEYLDPALQSGPERPVTEWIMRYWRGVVEDVWSRADGSFQLRVLITDLAGQPGEMDEDDVDLFRKNDVIYELEMHHNEGRGNQMFRPVEVAGVKLYKAVYTGARPTTVAHEFGHSLGLDDEYAQSKNPKPDRDCTALTGFEGHGVAEHWGYAMCDDWDSDNDTYTDSYNPPYVRQHTVKSVYPWIVTQRYSIGTEIRHCKEDTQCLDGEYCKKPVLGVNRCATLKSIGDNCTKDKQCAAPAVCKPKPFGKCIIEASKTIGERCNNNPECRSGKCNGGVCVCANDNHCPNGYCDKGTLSVGANECKTFKAIDEGCTRPAHCASGRCYLGKCKPLDECSDDNDCVGPQYCDKGTLSVGVNQCVALKPNDEGCSRPAQCTSGRCYLGKCKPQDECSDDNDCGGAQYCDKGTLSVGINQCVAEKPNDESCSRAGQCASDRCYLGKCKPQDECSNDDDCRRGSEYCDKGTLSVGINQCVTLKADGEGCTRAGQCVSNRCNLLGKCGDDQECNADRDCRNNQYCDEGTLGVGRNQCKTEKSLGDACSRGGQCASNCCKVYNFKVQCRPSSKCN